MKSLKVKPAPVQYAVLCAVLLCFAVVYFNPAVSAQANMAQPTEQRGSGVVFDKHQSVKVDSEVLNIKLNKPTAPKSSAYRGGSAYISAVYTMTNTTNEPVAVNAMFLSPGYSQIPPSSRAYTVTADGVPLAYAIEYFKSGYDYLQPEDLLNWEEILAAADPDSEDEYARYGGYVAAVSYSFDFKPAQTLELSVSYVCGINGNNYGGANRTRMDYFLTPAKYWKDFGKLTINLTLDDAQPYLIFSSLDFKRQKKGVYKFESDSLPKSELRITAGSLMGYVGYGSADAEVLFNFAVGIAAFAFAYLALFAAVEVVRRKKEKKSGAPRKRNKFLFGFHIALIAFIALLAALTFWAAFAGVLVWVYVFLALSVLAVGAIAFVLAAGIFGIAHFVGKRKAKEV
ncbi:MAG: hypothetical protein FWD58_05605 [Firmicutes bacterium]|nr:hypothetical protein [Bacillota bacterium]